MCELWLHYRFLFIRIISFYVSHENRRFATRIQEIDMIERQKYLKTFIVKLLIYLLVLKSILIVSGAATATGILENQFELFRWAFW